MRFVLSRRNFVKFNFMPRPFGWISFLLKLTGTMWGGAKLYGRIRNRQSLNVILNLVLTKEVECRSDQVRQSNYKIAFLLFQQLFRNQPQQQQPQQSGTSQPIHVLQQQQQQYLQQQAAAAQQQQLAFNTAPYVINAQEPYILAAGKLSKPQEPRTSHPNKYVTCYYF